MIFNKFRLTSLLTLCIIFCKDETFEKDHNYLKTLSSKKNSVITIDIDRNDYMAMKDDNTLRDYLLSLADKIKLYHPKVIYFDFAFTLPKKNPEIFAIRLNEKISTISLFEFNENKKEINFTDSVRGEIGSKVKGTTNNNSNRFKSISGIEFPEIEIIHRSKAICISGFSSKENRAIGIVPYYNYKDFTFESCPITIVNEYMSTNQLKIEFDFKDKCLALYSIPLSKKIKCLTGNEFKENEEIPLNFSSFSNYNAGNFLAKEFDIKLGMIFIVGVSIKNFKNKNDEPISFSEIVANEVYTLLDLASEP